MAMPGLFSSLACKLAGFLLLANKVEKGVDPDQLIWLYIFFSTWAQERIGISCLACSSILILYTMLFEMYVTNKTNTV